jgi:hypothetical protein
MAAITLNDEQIEALKKVLGYIDEGERTHLADNNYRPGYVYTFAAKLMPLVGMTPATMEDAAAARKRYFGAK